MRIPQACVIAVGGELVAGRREDGNGVRLARQLEALGCDVNLRCQVPDEATLIAQTVGAAFNYGVDLIVVTGGMGITTNDVTRDGAAEGLGTPLEFDELAYNQIEARYRERGREIPEGARRQAMRPRGSELVKNPLGIAPGFIVDRGRTLLVALPGVPREMQEMWQRTVAPLLRQRLAGAAVLEQATLHVAGLLESEVDRRIRGLCDEGQCLRVTLLASRGEVDVLITARAETEEEAKEQLRRAVEAVEAPLGDHVFGRDDETMVEVVRGLLLRRGWTLATAESITGGLIAKRIVDVPGSSTFYVGGLVPYADSRKQGLTGVSHDELERAGSVSPAVVRAMAEGACARLGASVGVGTVGIAGPGGGSSDRPVGLVYTAVALPGRTMVRRHLFGGSRGEIRSLTAATALDQTRRALAGLPLLGEVADAEGGAGG